MSYEFADVVLVPFPFTDQSTSKQRPAVVVSSRAYNGARSDIVLMAITSRVRTPLGFGEVLLGSWQDAGLLKPSIVKPLFATFEQRLVIRSLGTLVSGDKNALSAKLQVLLG